MVVSQWKVSINEQEFAVHADTPERVLELVIHQLGMPICDNIIIKIEKED